MVDVPDIFTVMAEVLQMHRSNKEVFIPVAELLSMLCSHNPEILSRSEIHDMSKRIAGIAQILKQKLANYFTEAFLKNR